MNINIELKKNFINAYNKMQNEYGEEMASINGFSAGQLSYTDFIDNFIRPGQYDLSGRTSRFFHY